MGVFSITVSVSSGVVAAFVFFLFEILIFPLALHATSTLAALTMQGRGKKGESIRVKSIVFPMWGEGLLSGQKSHVILLIFRIIVIGIPVYMETRLQAKEQPLFKTVHLPHVYEVSPVKNWAKYEKAAKDDIKTLRQNADEVGRRCVDYHEDRWVFSRTANLSYGAGKKVDKISCLNGTEKRLFKFYPELIPTECEGQSVPEAGEDYQPVYLKKNFTLGITISYGTMDSFADIADTPRLQSDVIFRVRNVTVLNDHRVRCFFENNFKALENISSVHLKIMCQMKYGDLLLYVTVGAPYRTVNVNFGLQAAVTPLKNKSINIAHTKVMTRAACMAWYKHMDPPILTPEHIVNIGPDFDLPIILHEMVEVLALALFTKKDNRTITIRSNQTKQATVMDYIFIYALIAEIAFVISFAMIMFFVSRFRLGLEVVPTTLNGLSQCWAQQDSPVRTKGGHVNLSLTRQIAVREKSIPLYYFENCEGTC